MTLVLWVAYLDIAHSMFLHVFFFFFLKKTGLAPLCENMPSGKANKPGDVVRARNGKTIQVCRWKTQPPSSAVPCLEWVQSAGPI